MPLQVADPDARTPQLLPGQGQGLVSRKRGSDKKAPACVWCGTRFRQRKGCARGPACEIEQANHETLEELVKEMKKK